MKTLKFCIYLICFLSISCEKDSFDSILFNEEVVYEYSDIEIEVFTLLNEYRKSLNLKELKISNLASKLAMEHNYYMIDELQISHDKFAERIEILVEKENAYFISENVASGQVSAQAVIDAWLNSLSHKENIEGDFTNVGISIRKSSGGKNYFTQLFYKK